MQQPLIWLALALLVIVLVGYLAWWRPRSQRLRLRIEPVPQARLDNTPVERTEIVSEVRVRRRNEAGDEIPARVEPTIDAVTLDAVSEAEPAETMLTGLAAGEPLETTAASMPEPVDETEAAEPPQPVAEPAPATRLSQADLFPDATVPVRPQGAPQSARVLFDALEAGEPVDAIIRSGNGSETLPEIEQVISLHVISRAGGLDGRKLLELLLQYGLRFGDMSIFHRHEFPTGHGMVLFSLAQAMEPGTFDLDTLERERISGVSLFLSLPGYKSLTAYDLMVDTARRLAKELDADLLDQHSQTVTVGQLDRWRDQVTEFERKRLMSS
ncbi:MAG: cell division protein ZipA [Perlucidibaca sp.]